MDQGNAQNVLRWVLATEILIASKFFVTKLLEWCLDLSPIKNIVLGVLDIACLGLHVWMVTVLCEWVFGDRPDLSESTGNEKVFVYWLNNECYFVISFILVNSVYYLLRFCKRPNYSLDINKDQMPCFSFKPATVTQSFFEVFSIPLAVTLLQLANFFGL